MYPVKTYLLPPGKNGREIEILDSVAFDRRIGEGKGDFCATVPRPRRRWRLKSTVAALIVVYAGHQFLGWESAAVNATVPYGCALVSRSDMAWMHAAQMMKGLGFPAHPDFFYRPSCPHRYPGG